MSAFEQNLIGDQVRLLLVAGGKLRVEHGELVSVDAEGLVLRIDGRDILFYRHALICLARADDDDEASMAAGDELLRGVFGHA